MLPWCLQTGPPGWETLRQQNQVMWGTFQQGHPNNNRGKVAYVVGRPRKRIKEMNCRPLSSMSRSWCKKTLVTWMRRSSRLNWVLRWSIGKSTVRFVKSMCSIRVSHCRESIGICSPLISSGSKTVGLWSAKGCSYQRNVLCQRTGGCCQCLFSTWMELWVSGMKPGRLITSWDQRLSTPWSNLALISAWWPYQEWVRSWYSSWYSGFSTLYPTTNTPPTSWVGFATSSLMPFTNSIQKTLRIEI